MRYDDDPGVLCEELGRCMEWFHCWDCGQCYCGCRCQRDEFGFRDEYGQGMRIDLPVRTVKVKGEFLLCPGPGTTAPTSAPARRSSRWCSGG